MEIHQLRYFTEVTRQGNFTRAAEHCHVAQPSLSQQIRKLEEELGQPLLKRTREGALLTDFGKDMYARAQKILSELAAMQEAAQSSAGECRGSLSVSAIPTVAPYFLPMLVEACARAYPGIELMLSEDTTDEMLAKLRQGRLDFGLLSPPYPFEHEMHHTPLGEDELLVTLNPRHPLAKAKSVTLADLTRYPIILMKEVHCLRRQSISLCESSGVKPSVRIESSQLETVIAMVESGQGFSFTPAIAVPSFKKRRVLFRSVEPAPVSREINLICPRQHALSAPQAAFSSLVQDLLRPYLSPRLARPGN